MGSNFSLLCAALVPDCSTVQKSLAISLYFVSTEPDLLVIFFKVAIVLPGLLKVFQSISLDVVCFLAHL